MKMRLLLGLILIFSVGCAPPEERPEINTAGEAVRANPDRTIDVPLPVVSPTEPDLTSTLPEPAPVEVQKPLTFEEQVWKKRIDAAMAPSYCPPVMKVEYPSSYYHGPLIDSHYHIPSLPDSKLGSEKGEEEIYQTYFGRNYEELSSFPICTQYQMDECDRSCNIPEDIPDESILPEQDACYLNCLADRRCREGDEEDNEPYLGKDLTISDIVCTLQHEGTTRNVAFFPIYPEIYPHALEIAKRTEEQYPNYFTPFLDWPSPENEDENLKAEVLSETLEEYPDVFKGWGEIHLAITEETLGHKVPPDYPLLNGIYTIIKKEGMIVYIHPAENQRLNFERILQQHPEIIFIVHGDEIKGDVDYLMSKYPNIYFTINNFYDNQDLFFDYQRGKPKTKESFFSTLEKYEPLIQKDLSAWKNLIEEHPNQVMWGLDRDEEVLWTFDRDVGLKLVDYGRAFIGRLDPAVQEKFAYKNAERLIERSE